MSKLVFVLASLTPCLLCPKTLLYLLTSSGSTGGERKWVNIAFCQKWVTWLPRQVPFRYQALRMQREVPIIPARSEGPSEICWHLRLNLFKLQTFCYFFFINFVPFSLSSSQHLWRDFTIPAAPWWCQGRTPSAHTVGTLDARAHWHHFRWFRSTLWRGFFSSLFFSLKEEKKKCRARILALHFIM